ncbi:unnamed protein product [Durusdinium trenchii]|uniref:Transmembrane protein n=1 Tax=Durusdinium trenchii TaxID=1381693 RepID=A0ABP0N862_9DINO
MSKDVEAACKPRSLKAEPVYKTVLMCPPSSSRPKLPNYQNLTPWVRIFFFAHTYYAYIYTFYMFVFAFYKGYALYYPQNRKIWEIVGIMMLPCVQHLRFFFGHWGLELGLVYDLVAFLFLSSVKLLILMYFLFEQAYIMRLDVRFLTMAVAAVVVESVCGIINVLQTMKLATLNVTETILLLASVVSVLTVASYFVVEELLPSEIRPELGYLSTLTEVPEPRHHR